MIETAGLVVVCAVGGAITVALVELAATEIRRRRRRPWWRAEQKKGRR